MSHPVDEIKAKIDSIFGDTSVSKRETLDSLTEIVDHMEFMFGCLQDEIQREEG